MMNNEIQKYIEQIKKEEDIFSRARLLQHLVHDKNQRITDLAKSLGKTSSYICHLLRLTTLPDLIIDGYYTKQISISHLFILSRIKDQKKLIELYEKILGANYTVQQTEELVREVLYEIKSKGKYLNKEEIQNLIEEIHKKFNVASIKIIQTRIKGKIIIEVKGNLEETSKILQDILKK